MDTNTKRKAAPRWFKPGVEFANPRVSRVLIGYGRSGYVSVRDWNGDRVRSMGAGGGGYDKTGVCLAQVLTALAGDEGMRWLAQNYGSGSGSMDKHGQRGLYGLSWRIVEAPRTAQNMEKARKLTAHYRAKSHKAPKRIPKGYALWVSLDGACGVSSVETCALALGLAWDRCNAGKDADTYSARVVPTVLESYDGMRWTLRLRERTR